MSVPCFTRTERNGMFVIQSLAGRMKHDCLIVNETVKFTYDQVTAGMPLDEVVARFRERALHRPAVDAAANGNGNGNGAARTVGDPHSEEERIRFDLYRILMSFRDREIGDYEFADIVTLLPQGRVLRGTTQVMPICALDETAAFIARGLDAARGPDKTDVEVFYSFPAAESLNPEYFAAEQIVRRHLDQIEVYFIGTDAAGRVDTVTAIQGLPQQPATLRMFFCAARADAPAAYEERVGIHLARLCGLVQVTTLSAKIRFQWTTGEEPRATRHPVLDTVLADLGFRRSLVLSDEFGPGNALVAHDRALF